MNHHLALIVGALICIEFISSKNLERSNDVDIISRARGNILKNLTKTHKFEDNIVTSRLDASNFIRRFYRSSRELYNRLLGGTGQRTSGNFLQERIADSVPFPCRTEGYRSRTIPSSVHQLRPGDIDIVAAMGDSLTSATAANSVALWELMVENRGVSWSIGGQGTWRTHLTLPNILKVFNPNLFGYSLSDSYNVHRSAQFNVAENIATTSDMPYNAEKLVKRINLDSRYSLSDSYNVHRSAQFNVAENIATTSDMPYNAEKLVKRINLDSRVDMQKHWKLLTLMIGGNDFCSDICYQTNATQWINESQERNLIKTLRYLRDNMPRTLVNLVPTPLVNLMFSMDAIKKSFTCSLSLPVECSCLFGPKYSKQRNDFRQKERTFTKIMEKISFLPDFSNENFTVVYQPFFKEASVFLDDSEADLSVVSVDCLHLSQKGHALAANALWNNMMERVGRKSLGLKPFLRNFECPHENRSYIYTNRNS